ncbi:MAG: hypothetical protein L6V85_06735 [Clostridiales bacterium]|nr:MAG: hypothetical protein L6V85_06735 [Clostridiales bacterium]
MHNVRDDLFAQNLSLLVDFFQCFQNFVNDFFSLSDVNNDTTGVASRSLPSALIRGATLNIISWDVMVSFF